MSPSAEKLSQTTHILPGFLGKLELDTGGLKIFFELCVIFTDDEKLVTERFVGIRDNFDLVSKFGQL